MEVCGAERTNAALIADNLLVAPFLMERKCQRTCELLVRVELILVPPSNRKGDCTSADATVLLGPCDSEKLF